MSSIWEMADRQVAFEEAADGAEELGLHHYAHYLRRMAAMVAAAISLLLIPKRGTRD